MKHFHLGRVLYVTMVAFILTTAALLSIYSQFLPRARAIDLFVPFGGTISAIPMTNPLPPPAVGLNPACPVYYTVTSLNLDNGLGPVFGIFIPSIPPGISYDFNNLATPGTPVLGGVVPVPCVGGTAPLPLYPVYYDAADGGFYLDGTGGLINF